MPLSFEHRVHVADEQHPIPAALLREVLGDQVSCAMHRLRHRDPTCLEAETLEFLLKIAPDFTNAGRIEGSAVRVDDLLESCDFVSGVGVNRLDDVPFRTAELLGVQIRGERKESKTDEQRLYPHDRSFACVISSRWR